MPAPVNFITKGFNVLLEADKTHESGNLSKALELYHEGIDFLNLGLSHGHTSPESQAIIRGKVRAASARAKTIEVCLEDQQTSSQEPRDFLPKGVELIREAVHIDEAGNPSKALRLYRQGLEYLTVAHAYELNESSKAVIAEKNEGYRQRVKAIESRLLKGDGDGDGGASARSIRSSLSSKNDGNDASKYIHEGIEIIREAVNADEAGNMSKALQLYRKGIESLKIGLKLEREEKSRDVIAAKIAEYEHRAQDISTFCRR